ncbi:xylulokinase [Cohnella massiliensis]|uniref:xylulokinase n=1 Tax=Cohnella massiliensis TaxID=1816691 RepID=UPI0009BAEDD1|nr:FGGY family carbohydrate kinase [Cohnella massiliensis]
MKYIAAFDIGTTNVKGILVSQDMGVRAERDVPLRILQSGQRMEQHPDDWYAAVADISRHWFSAGIAPEAIVSVTFSGQMQDCIPVDERLRPIRPAILYSDGRASAESDRLRADIGDEEIFRVTGNHMDGTLTFPKLLWLREHEPDAYERTAGFLISAKDYVVARLTGELATDPTAASTSGCMAIATRDWAGAWFERYGLDPGKMPPVRPSDEQVGVVVPEAAAFTGFAPGTPVLCGIGDAGAATLGAGIYREGDLYAYIGTTGWVAAAASAFVDVSSGAFNLSYVKPKSYIAIAPVLNAGNVMEWALAAFGPAAAPGGAGAEAGGPEPGGTETAETAYEAFERLLRTSDRSANELLFLPYLNGERCPVQNGRASGSMIGLRPTSTKADMGVAVLEGVAFALRQMMEVVAPAAPAPSGRRMTMIGGGTKSRLWCQIMADIFGFEIAVPGEAQYLPSAGAAALAFAAVGWTGDYREAVDRLGRDRQEEIFVPDPELIAHYERKYERYKLLYPALEALF